MNKDAEIAAAWDAAAARLIADRSDSGAAVVRKWAAQLPPRARVLDLGCGAGMPVSQVLLEQGCDVHAIDASPRLLAAYRARFPDVPTACEPAETSHLFGGEFDAIVAVGLIFLLSQGAQHAVLQAVAAGLKPGGRLLFNAPMQPARWRDLTTGHESVSLGFDRYVEVLRDAGMLYVDSYTDEGGSHYYDSRRH